MSSYRARKGTKKTKKQNHRSNPSTRTTSQVGVHFSLDVRCSTEDLRAYVRRYGPQVIAGTYAPIRVSVHGYDDDPRELWEIPEVADLCQRVIDSGLLSLLSLEADPSLFGWSAWELCGCAFGFFRGIRGGAPGSVIELGVEEAERVHDAIMSSGVVCDTLLAKVA